MLHIPGPRDTRNNSMRDNLLVNTEKSYNYPRCYLELRESTPITLVLSVEEDLSWGSIADRLLAEATLATPRPVALDMVLDLVIPRALGEVGVRESVPAPAGVLVLPPPVLGRDGVVEDSLASLLALMVAESTVFCRLKLEVVV